MFAAILTWLLAQPISHHDRHESYDVRHERLSLIAEAIATVAQGNWGLASFLSVQAYKESGLRADVQACQCPRHECDGGLARGPWQIQPSWTFRERWMRLCEPGREPLILGAQYIARFYKPERLAVSFSRLAGSGGRPNAPWVQERVELTHRALTALRGIHERQRQAEQ